jgi:hypothetical protein
MPHFGALALVTNTSPQDRIILALADDPEYQKRMNQRQENRQIRRAIRFQCKS